MFWTREPVPTTLRIKRLHRRCSCCCCCHRCCRCCLSGGGRGQLDSGFKCKTQAPCLLRHQRAASLRMTVTCQSLSPPIALTALDRRREAALSQKSSNTKLLELEIHSSALQPFLSLLFLLLLLFASSSVSECAQNTAISPPAPTS